MDKPITRQQLQQAVSDRSLSAAVSDLSFDILGEVGALLAEMHNDGTLDGISFLGTLDVAGLSNRDRTRMAYVLKGFLGGVRDTTERIVSFVHDLHDNASDSLAYNIRQGFETWIAANPAKISQVANIIKDGDRDSEFFGMVLLAWRRTEPSKALDAAISLSGGKWASIRRQATYALGSFEYADQKEALRAEERVADIVSSDDLKDQRAAIFAIGRILDKQPEAEKSTRLVAVLEGTAERPNDDIRRELIAGLVSHHNAYPLSLREKVLALSETVQSDSIETLDLIDQALSRMDADSDRNRIFRTLTAILTQKTEAPALKKFDAIVHKIATSGAEVHGWYVTSWLLEGEYRTCTQLDSLFPPLDNSVYDFKLEDFGLSDAEVFYLAHKIYAYLMFCHGPAVSLLSACLMSLKPKQRKVLENGISSFWLRNYPGDLELFDAVHGAYPRRGLKASIKRMRQLVEAYQAPLRALPQNRAMQPSTLERRVQGEIAHERNKEIGRVAEENSIFAGLFHKSTLLYGRSSVVYVYPDSSGEPIRQVMQLQSFETSSALPRMDILYPARLNYLIYRLRAEERPQ